MPLADSGANVGGIIGGIFAGLVIIGLYWVPTIVALIRRREIPNIGSIIVINLFLGLTIVGWVVALAMACRSRPSEARYAPPGGWQQMPPPYQPGITPPGPPNP